MYIHTPVNRLDKNKKGQCNRGINVISCDANASPSYVTLKINGPLMVVAVRGINLRFNGTEGNSKFFMAHREDI
jgi:hypothetical protein